MWITDIQVEEISTERAGAAVACVAPLFSQRPDIHQWLYHYTQLGVNKFHMCAQSLNSFQSYLIR